MRFHGAKPLLAKSRWLLLSRYKRVRGKRRETLQQLLRRNLATVRAYILKEDFVRFWRYRHPTWAKYFFDAWTSQALRSRIDSMRDGNRGSNGFMRRYLTQTSTGTSLKG